MFSIVFVAGLSCSVMDDKIMTDDDFHGDGWISASAIRLVKVRVNIFRSKTLVPWTLKLLEF